MTAIEWYSRLTYAEKIKIKRQQNIILSDSSLDTKDIEKMYKKYNEMKKLLIAFIAILTLQSCSKGVNPSDSIGLSAAFSYCAGLTSYWVWGIATTIACGAVFYMVFKADQKKGNYRTFIYFILLALIAFAWMYAPSEVAWNTTVEQMQRGVYIR